MVRPLPAALALLLASASPLAASDSFDASVKEAAVSIQEALRPARAAGRPALSPPEAGAYATDLCRPETDADAKLRSGDFRWGYSLPEMLDAFDKTYESAKRLPLRAHWNARAGRLELPYMPERGGPVVLPEVLVRAVTRHIEKAFEAGAADAVFFPDMGHSHLLVPQALWSSKYDRFPVERFSQLYTEMFSDPRVEVFYHTAEQLQTRSDDGALVGDARTQQRYRTRNIAGPVTVDAELRVLQNPESRANTVKAVPGYFWWGAGFNLSANRNGCFSYTANGKTYRYDLSLFDLEPEPER